MRWHAPLARTLSDRVANTVTQQLKPVTKAWHSLPFCWREYTLLRRCLGENNLLPAQLCCGFWEFSASASLVLPFSPLFLDFVPCHLHFGQAWFCAQAELRRPRLKASSDLWRGTSTTQNTPERGWRTLLCCFLLRPWLLWELVRI